MGSLFIFIGLPGPSSDANLSVLEKALRDKFLKNEIVVSFTRKGELLLSSKLDGVCFYISFLKNNIELKDWYQAAIDGELMLDKKPITKMKLSERYKELKSSSGKYKKIHYAIGLIIMEEIEKFSDLEIFTFQ